MEIFTVCSMCVLVREPAEVRFAPGLPDVASRDRTVPCARAGFSSLPPLDALVLVKFTPQLEEVSLADVLWVG